MDDLPNLSRLPEELHAASRELGAELARAGFRSWIVGGAVRDQVLCRTPTDVDIATDATPDEVEACFRGTVPLGKRFGTVLVMQGNLGIEVTSLRTEAGYSDARRPDSVEFGTSVNDDATRRDFTCNAMYLDTQSGEFLDPVHGLRDTKSRSLKAVGEPAARFAEDGLRILRLARLSATLDMSIEPATLEGARLSKGSLRGVSGERLYAELERGLSTTMGSSMLATLADIEVREAVFAWASDGSEESSAAVFGRWPYQPGLLEGLLVFADPKAGTVESGSRASRFDVAAAALQSLKPTRSLRRQWESSWHLAASLEDADGDELGRADLRLLMREDAWEAGSGLALASLTPGMLLHDRIVAWREERRSLSESELFPTPWIDAEMLREAGVAPGAQWGELMAEGLHLQLDEAWVTRAEARLWLDSEIK